MLHLKNAILNIGVMIIELKDRQKAIVEIVKANEPITGEGIAKLLGMSRSAIRSDLSILIMSGLLEAKPKVGYFYVTQSERQRIYDYIKSIKVNDIKSLPVVVDEKTSVYDAIVLMFLEDVGSIFVISEGCLSGIVSRKDFLKTAIGGADIKQMPVGIIMTRMPKLIMTHPNEPVFEAARKIVEHQIDALPVVEETLDNGRICCKIVGRISKTTIARLFAEMGVRDASRLG